MDKRTVVFDEQKIDAIFAELNQCRLPGAAVGIAIAGQPVYRKGFGLASMELPVVLSPSIRMRIGSTTKHFAAFAYMLLCEEGKAGIDDEVGKYLPELHAVNRRATVRQLMGNISGLRDACDISLQFSGTERARATSDDLMAFYRDIDDINAAPGTAWIYNNAGWVMLGVIIERITGQSLEEVMQSRIFEPVGMHDTLLRRWDTDYVPNSATPHMPTKDGRFERQYWAEDLSGAGSIVSTVNDMLRWMAHMDAPTVGTPATWTAMKTPQLLANGTSTGYALGLVSSPYRGIQTLHHAGNWTGANAQMLKVPSAKLDIVVLVNRSDVWGFDYANRIVDACVQGLEPLREAFAGGPRATGTFQSVKTGRFVSLLPGDAQQLVMIDGVEMPFEPDADGVLRLAGYTGSYMKKAVTPIGDRAQPNAIRLDEFGNCDELQRVPAENRPEAQAIAGCYTSRTTGTEAVVSASAEGARLRMRGRFGAVDFSLECLAKGVWKAKVLSPGVILPPSGLVSFDADGETLRYSTLLTRSLPFTRVA